MLPELAAVDMLWQIVHEEPRPHVARVTDESQAYQLSALKRYSRAQQNSARLEQSAQPTTQHDGGQAAQHDVFNHMQMHLICFPR